ncbi:phage minor head protein [Aurantimonas sp. 22II-16-19i]|uniref:phage head morphogenesis protein n=1 Tax=Aurantimonas sp. 22II-16-19i TaxID=1317114 RepID=UPI0009F7D2FA|nr:phage minor head protein [Aurantimonas sp. 22II-16-19i]ORE85385.1 prophage MuSo2 F protein [Aurantimonas sp. 22II-16-19i]
MAIELQALPFTEAIAALERRGATLKPQFSWLDDWQADHATMFTVAKSAGFDVLGDIFEAYSKALSEGRTFRDFSRELTPALQAKGWWGRQLVTDPLTGEQTIAHLGSTRRLATIFDANMRVSYAAGHWSSFARNKAARPFLRYVHLEGQENPRLQHQAWHNTVLLVDDPWWNTHACPNGWGCKCTLQSLSQRDVDRLLSQGVPLKFEAPVGGSREWLNKRTGEIQRVPDGIDPGWAYNPGKAGFEAQRTIGAEKLARSAEGAAKLADSGDGPAIAAEARIRHAAELVREPALGSLLEAAKTFDHTDRSEASSKAGRRAVPLAILSDEQRQEIGAGTNSVVLSLHTAAKQIAHHPEVTREDYGLVQQLIETAPVRIEESDREHAFGGVVNGTAWWAVVKSIRESAEVFLTSLRRMSRRQIRKFGLNGEKRKGGPGGS